MTSLHSLNANPRFPVEKARSNAGPQDSVDARSAAWLRQRDAWDLIDDLRAGTQRMREVGRKWLPQEEGEEKGAYDRRLQRSTLYEVVDDTIKNLVSKPFSKSVVVNGELPDRLRDIEHNVDQQGTTLTSFGATVLDNAIEHGLCAVWVDYPRTEGIIQNLQQEREANVRPIFTLISGDMIIGYKSEVNSTNGKVELVEIRFIEWRTEPAGEYGDVDVQYIRIIRAPNAAIADLETNPGGLGTWELHRYDSSAGTWSRVEAGTHTYPGMPVEVFYTDKVAFMEASPPILSLAYLSLEHWQKKSDLDWAIHHSAFPMLFIKGLTKEERDRPTQIGPTRTFKSTNDRSEMSWVEMTGAAIEQAQQDITRLEDRMELLGVEPLVDRVTTTATGKHQQAQRRGNQVQEWIRNLEAVLRNAYKMAAKWIKVEIADDSFDIDIFNDFGVTLRGIDDLDRIIALRKERFITHETLLREVKRRGALSELFDVENELEAIENENPLPNDEDENEDGIGFDDDE